jgi:hypothetical protein
MAPTAVMSRAHVSPLWEYSIGVILVCVVKSIQIGGGERLDETIRKAALFCPLASIGFQERAHWNSLTQHVR